MNMGHHGLFGKGERDVSAQLLRHVGPCALHRLPILTDSVRRADDGLVVTSISFRPCFEYAALPVPDFDRAAAGPEFLGG